MLNLVSCCLLFSNTLQFFFFYQPTNTTFFFSSQVASCPLMMGVWCFDCPTFRYKLNSLIQLKIQHSSLYDCHFLRRLLLLRADVVQTNLSQLHCKLPPWASYGSQSCTIIPLYFVCIPVTTLREQRDAATATPVTAKHHCLLFNQPFVEERYKLPRRCKP